jgi:hypothetical protein
MADVPTYGFAYFYFLSHIMICKFIREFREERIINVAHPCVTVFNGCVHKQAPA